MNLFKSSVLCGMVIVSFMTSCTDVDITMPKGPKGDTGLSAYEFWKEKVADGTVNWPKDQTEVADFFKFLKGKDGKDGKDGQCFGQSDLDHAACKSCKVRDKG